MTEISAELAGLPSQEIASGMTTALRRVGEQLGLDRVTVFEVGARSTSCRVLQQWTAPGIEAVSSMMPEEVVPWAVARIRSGEAVSFEDLEELPDEAAVDRGTFRDRLQARSHLSLPLRIGGSMVGCLSLSSLRARRGWPASEMAPLRLLAEIFGAAVARHRAHRDLHAKESRYGSFVRNSTEVIWCLGLEEPMPIDLPGEEQVDWLYRHARVVEANQLMAELYGFTNPREMIGWGFKDLMPRELPSSVPTILAASRAGYKLKDLETIERDRDGNELVFLNNFNGEFVDGKLHRLWGTARDVTAARKAAEETRLRSAALEASPDGSIIVDGRGEDMPIVYVNRAFTAMTGYEPAEVMGRNCRLLQGEDTDPGVVDEMREAISNATSFRGELLNYRKDGTPFWNSLRFSPVVGIDGSATHFLGSLVDVTQQREAAVARQEMEREVREHREQLAHADRLNTMGELTAAIAHELNQPLTAITSNARAAQRFMAAADVDLDEIREILGDVVEDGQRAAEVIRRMRALLEKREVQRQLLDLNELVRQVADLVHSDGVIRNVALAFDLQDQLPAIAGDPVQLQQVILNLIQNGFEAMEGGGGADRRLSLQTRSEGGVVNVSVRDVGVGLQGRRTEELFAPFVTTKRDGMGMGLAICRSIVEAHGGRMWASENQDRGATWGFTLPTERSGEAPADRG